MPDLAPVLSWAALGLSLMTLAIALSVLRVAVRSSALRAAIRVQREVETRLDAQDEAIRTQQRSFADLSEEVTAGKEHATKERERSSAAAARAARHGRETPPEAAGNSAASKAEQLAALRSQMGQKLRRV